MAFSSDSDAIIPLKYWNIDFVPLGDSETNVGSLTTDKSNNGKDLMNFIVEVWGLDQCSECFITLKNVEILLQYKLLDALKIYKEKCQDTPWTLN